MPNDSAIIAKAIIAYSSKMGKKIRYPKDTSTVDILVLIPVAAQQVFECIFIPLCVDITIQKLNF